MTTKTNHVWMPDSFRVLDADLGAITVTRILRGERIGDWIVTTTTGESEIVSEGHAFRAWKYMPAA